MDAPRSHGKCPSKDGVVKGHRGKLFQPSRLIATDLEHCIKPGKLFSLRSASETLDRWKWIPKNNSPRTRGERENRPYTRAIQHWLGHVSIAQPSRSVVKAAIERAFFNPQKSERNKPTFHPFPAQKSPFSEASFVIEGKSTTSISFFFE
jgi:hypothetical protein